MKKLLATGLLVFGLMITGMPAFASDSALSKAEEAGMYLMREEEKLARDVYLELYDEWKIPIFSNIAKSEQTHMNAVKSLLDQYGLVDPISQDNRGVFENDELQRLYNDLTALGKQDISSAFIVGARVEELDIYDLERLMKQTSNSSILAVYENLVKGSRNHLRSFYSQILRNGAEFIPEYISQAEFETIVGSSTERGRR